MKSNVKPPAEIHVNNYFSPLTCKTCSRLNLSGEESFAEFETDGIVRVAVSGAESDRCQHCSSSAGGCELGLFSGCRIKYQLLPLAKRVEFVKIVEDIGREYFVGDKDVQVLDDDEFVLVDG